MNKCMRQSNLTHSNKPKKKITFLPPPLIKDIIKKGAIVAKEANLLDLNVNNNENCNMMSRKMLTRIKRILN